MANMCLSTKMVEDDDDGNDNFDSVFLSLTEQENNCSCTFSVKNANTPVNLYIKRLNNLADKLLCGMEKDIYFIRRNEMFQTNRIPTRCDSKENTISLSLFGNEHLQFTSRVVDGNFSIGYCIQIAREHKQGYADSFLEISCDHSAVTTPPGTLTQTRTTLKRVTTSVPITSTLSFSTTMIDKPKVNDKTDYDGKLILSICFFLN
ncbi:Hypothetical predicted protein [Mytilus galloprovincialis]|uniref:Uncharacterized protein n=1 Tax=Mytilus galloprovincialis TaxID=29158 RepID=A0A8B6HE92_MYTGA|nr:Hypothetical predicted protein [Mytilus galloprovincialis]